MSLREWMTERRIVLEVDARQALLLGRQQLELIGRVVARRLKQDAVEFATRDIAGSDLVEIVRPWERSGSAAVWMRSASFHGHVEVMWRLREIPQIVAVDVPGE